MKKAAEIIQNLKSYQSIFLDHAREARKRYYLEDRKFYKDMRFDEFLDYRSKLHLIEDIMGVNETDIRIVIYG